ncbi:MAG: LacI family DNA-binding transcriptional regulator [Candidatus Izimaplasma sp.]|nr:LacI family DNA-binding transcriptional regulator [Candidatus Izimaplasma bacterium]
MATLKEIAQKVGVSITTVSRVLNYDKSLKVSDKVRKNIIETASELNYKTPRQRTSIVTKNSVKIAMVHYYEFKEELDDPYYISIRRGIEKLAAKSNIEVSLFYKEDGNYDFSNLSVIDGMVCIGKFSTAEIKQFEKVTPKLVFVDSTPDASKYDSVVIDFNKAVRKLLQAVIDKGYKNIGYIGGQETISKTIKLGERRELVFREFLFQKGLLDKTFIHVGTFTKESGYKIMKNILQTNNHADVYFCANDSIALGVLKAIHESKLKIPQEIALIGFNDNPTSEYTFPPLSTIRVHTEFMGEQALLSLIEIIEGRTIPVRKVIPTEFVIRKSFVK